MTSATRQVQRTAGNVQEEEKIDDIAIGQETKENTDSYEDSGRLNYIQSVKYNLKDMEREADEL